MFDFYGFLLMAYGCSSVAFLGKSLSAEGGV